MMPQTIPMARATDPQTSFDAAKSVRQETVTQAQINILVLLCNYGGLTDEEIAQKWHAEHYGPISPSGLRTRRAELKAKGHVGTGFWGERRATATGRLSLVWHITEAGLAYLEGCAK